MKRNYKFETLQLHVGQETPDTATGSRAVPVYATTSYVFKDCAQAAGRFALSEPGNIYTRLIILRLTFLNKELRLWKEEPGLWLLHRERRQ